MNPNHRDVISDDDDVISDDDRRELSRRARRLLSVTTASLADFGDEFNITAVDVGWLAIDLTRTSLVLSKQTGITHALIYAEDNASRKMVSCGSANDFRDTLELLRQHMILDDLANLSED